MNKKYCRLLLLVIVGIFFFASSCWAVTLLTEKEALSVVFDRQEDIRPEIYTITDMQLQNVEKVLQGKFVEFEQGQGTGEFFHKKDYTFYFVAKDGRPIGVALVLEEPGKWGPIEYMIRMSLEGVIEDIAVMRYTETRGRPIARKSFLRQFIGKTLLDPLELGNDIVAVSGATISSRATAFVVKKAIALYKECYLS